MKRQKLMITFLSATAFSVGCNKEVITSPISRRHMNRRKTVSNKHANG
jgi:hypothetical protein